MEEQYFQFHEGNKMGIKTVDERIIIPAVYDFVVPLSDGLFNVREGNYTAYFDTEGNEVLPFSNKYESYGNFTEGLARVKTHGKWGFINKEGKEVIAPQFYYVDDFSDGLAIVRNEQDLHGAIDVNGNLVIGYRFSNLTNFERGYAKFGDLKTWGLIDKAGNIVVPQEYISIGTVRKNKVTVQVLEGEEYKEGILTIGGGIEWNSNLDHINEFNKEKKEFSVACEKLISAMYAGGCPCEYERFRHFIQWNNPVGFIDQEILYSAFSAKLEDLGNDQFKCPHCGTCYTTKWTQYSAFMWVLNVQISVTGNLTNKGAAIPVSIPFALGFYGYNLEKYTTQYAQHDIETVISYLKEQ
jgi:WG repeat protein